MKYYCNVIEKTAFQIKCVTYEFLSEKQRDEFEAKCKKQGKTTTRSLLDESSKKVVNTS